MKAEFVFSISSRVLEAGERLVVCVPDYKFLSGWSPVTFSELCKQRPIHPFLYQEGGGSEEIAEAAYFGIPPGMTKETLESLAIYMSVRLFVCAPQQDFFEKMPSVVQQAIVRHSDEFDEDVILAASSMSGFNWMALRDGDEGDPYYYLFDAS